MSRAVIFVQRGAPADKQTTACLRYVLSERWAMLAIVPFWQPDDAVKLARDGRIDKVVAAFDSKAVQQLAVDLDGEASVVVVHPEPRVIEAPKRKLGSLGDLIVRWFRKGKSVSEIAEDIGEDTTDVRAILRRYGEHPDQTP